METVEHLILRCASRVISRGKFIGRIGNKSVEELCREKPIEVLIFLNYEELLVELVEVFSIKLALFRQERKKVKKRHL